MWNHAENLSINGSTMTFDRRKRGSSPMSAPYVCQSHPLSRPALHAKESMGNTDLHELDYMMLLKITHFLHRSTIGAPPPRHYYAILTGPNVFELTGSITGPCRATRPSTAHHLPPTVQLTETGHYGTESKFDRLRSAKTDHRVAHRHQL